jgi:acylphosphatase
MRMRRGARLPTACELAAVKALSLHITGVVQGVGFRPFIYNLARSSGLEGWVLNSSEGVFCLVQGDPDAVDAFPDAIRAKAPPMSSSKPSSPRRSSRRCLPASRSGSPPRWTGR